MKSNWHLITFSFFLSLLTVIGVHLTLGSYFESYEVLFQQFMLENCSYSPTMRLSISHFGLIPIYAKLTNAFPSIPIFSLANTIYITIAIWGILSAFALSIKNSQVPRNHYFLAVPIFIIAISNIFYINNVRISLLAATGAFFWLHLITKYRLSKKYYLLFFILIVLSFEIRNEMLLIASLIASCIFLLFKQKKQFLLVLSISIISLGTLAFVNNRMHTLENDKYILHEAEHAYFDRDDFLFDLTSKKEIAKSIAIKMFYLDEGIITMNDYSNRIQHKSIYSYIFKNKRFPSIYWNKLVELYPVLLNYKWLFILNFSLLFILIQSYKTNKYKIFFISSIIITIPFIINIILFVPLSFMIGFFSSSSLIMLMGYIIHSSSSKINKGILQLSSFGILLLFFSYLHTESQALKTKESTSSMISAKIAESNEKGQFAIFSFPKIEGTYSSRLFASKKDSKQKHYYLNLFFFGFYDNFKKYNQDLYGPKHGSLKERVLFCANNNVVFFSDASQNEYLKDYLKEIHDIEILFERNNILEGELFQTYTIKVL